jgi:hypothetical protein
MTEQHIVVDRIDVCTETSDGAGTITSNLRTAVTRKEADVLEGFLLALACEGVTFDERYARALTTTIDKLANL